MEFEFGDSIRQGDVLLLYIKNVENIEPGVSVPPVKGEVILAYGEATGHHHAVKSSAVNLIENSQGKFLYVKELAPLTHEEHTAHLLPIGVAMVIIQSEYTPEAIRSVID